MNKKINTIFILILLCCYPVHATEQAKKLPKYLEYPLEYLRFKAERIIRRSNFGCLPDEIIQKHIKPHLAYAVMTEFKQRLLNYNWQRHRGLGLRSVASHWKSFQNHDGIYIMVPDIADYAMWDGDTGKYEDQKIIYESGTILNTSKIWMHINSQHRSNSYCSTQMRNKSSNDKIFVCGLEKYCCKRSQEPVSLLLNKQENVLAVYSGQNIDLLSTVNCAYEEIVGFRFTYPIISVCAGHHLPFFVIWNKRYLTLTTFDEKHRSITMHSSQEDFPLTSIQLSPDDAYVCLNGYHGVLIYSMHDKNASSNYKKWDIFHAIIRKIIFSPDSTKLLIALQNGRLLCCSDFFKRQTLEFSHYDCYSPTWRYEDVAHIDHQAPRILWGDNDLLFSLDPTSHIDSEICTFVVYHASTGRFLTACKFFSHNPIAMGLTKDQEAVIFVHKDHKVSRVNLYNYYPDHFDIDFIQNKASLYELCCLWGICKDREIAVDQNNFEEDKNAGCFVEQMRSMIREFRESESDDTSSSSSEDFVIGPNINVFKKPENHDTYSSSSEDFV